ncbi:MAG: helix-turn-helix domain-containing protein [Gaiellaceae bacterium]
MPRQKSDHVDSAAGLARRLREARERAGLSQRALARGICTAAYVSRLEKGERIPSLQLLRRLASRLGADADELASGRPGSANDPLLDAEVALGLGDTLEAERLFTAALDPDDRALRARALAGLGEIAYSIGDARGAVALLEEAAETHPQGAFAVAGPLGRAYAQLSDLEAAVGVFEQALAGAEQREDTFERLRYAVLLADVLIDSGDPQRAADVLRTVVDAHDEPDDPLARARLWRSQALRCEERGDRQTADRYARRALEAVALANHTKYVARAHKLLARVSLDPEDSEHALELLDATYPAVERSGDAYEIATLRIEQARLLARLGRADEAASFAREAAAALRNARPADAAHGLVLAADVLTLLGDHARAAELNQLASEALERSKLAARVEP